MGPGPAVDAECKKVYFAGDTGPQFVRRQGSRGRGRETRVPRAQGDWEYFGGFDLAMIPIMYFWFSFAFRYLTSFQCIRAEVVHVEYTFRAAGWRPHFKGYQDKEGCQAR